MSLKIIVDYDLCEANAICVRVAPEIFEVDDEDNLNLHMEEVPDNLLEKAQEAVRRCPRQALQLVEG
jgi:ferredoxin